jgi:3-hydroxyacyl-[acyl-carrier-protein] dehydratase
MDLDHFQLIDRIVDLNLDEKKITVEAQVPAVHSIFEGHFPGLPDHARRTADRSDGAEFRLAVARRLKFERMPFLAIVKEAKMRGYVSPGQLLTIDGEARARRAPASPSRRQKTVGKELKCSAELTFGLAPFPTLPCACTWTRRPTRSASHCRR